jgi:hypothetical protein
MMAVMCLKPAFSFAQERASRVEQEQQFFQTLNDIPLMPGLYEMLEESVVFDKPEGRIAESAAASEDLAAQEIHAFYQQALPQLGWNQAGENRFVRQGESLTLKIENRGEYNVVRFMVSPH